MVIVPVVKRGLYEGRLVQPGETLCVSPAEAAALHRTGLISLTRGYVAAHAARFVAARDLMAERPACAEAEIVEVRRRRQYRRRDLEAEI